MANSKKRCKHCKEYFQVAGMVKVPAGVFCTIRHASDWARETSRKKAAKSATAKKKDDLVRVMSLSQLCSKAQIDFNSMIRAADIYLGHRCIATGGDIEHAGHLYHAGTKYRTSWLRFFHGNVHGQSLYSNKFCGGDEVKYRAGLLERYGQSYCDDVENMKQLADSGQLPTPTKEELLAMAKWCRAMARIYRRKTL